MNQSHDNPPRRGGQPLTLKGMAAAAAWLIGAAAFALGLAADWHELFGWP